MRVLRTAVVLMVVLGSLSSPVAANEAAENTQKPLRVFYDQGFRLASTDGAFSLRLNGLLQMRYSFVDYDPKVRFNHEDYSNFFVRRARLYFSGQAGSPRFTYFIHIQLEPTQGINANDLWVEYKFSDLVQLGGGRMKISYGLEFMNSGSALGMVERSLMYGETDIDLGSVSKEGPRYPGGGTDRFALSSYAHTGFATGGMTLYRSQGVQLRGHRGSDSTPTFEYQIGLWQGRSTTSLSNGGGGHLLALRVGYHPWGFVDWRVVGDVSETPDFKLGVIGSMYTNTSETVTEFDERGYNLAAVARFRGWSIDAEWGTEIYDFAAFADDFEREGWRVAAGWYVVPNKLEVRIRRAAITRLKDPTYRAANESGLGTPQVTDGVEWVPAIEAEISETSAAVSYRLFGWRNKVALDVSRLVRTFAADPDAVVNGVPTPIAKAPAQVDYRVRTMVQLVF
ncbi:MAG: OprO/OprP family phosphate-selective porin [Acidobacteria bacterium]|nr:OprO/OprP family phosphate-selective porin [Acidobacteriota bacterium]